MFSLSLCRCVCNIDCSHISFNPVCASDGRSYDNPCQVKEVSCQKQERIEVKYLGHCKGQSQLSIFSKQMCSPLLQPDSLMTLILLPISGGYEKSYPSHTISLTKLCDFFYDFLISITIFCSQCIFSGA